MFLIKMNSCANCIPFVRQVNVAATGNAALHFHSLRDIRNGTCTNCEYYMEICFSLEDSNCSLIYLITKSWQIGFGEQHKFSGFETLKDAKSGSVRNPIWSKIDKWEDVCAVFTYSIRSSIYSSRDL